MLRRALRGGLQAAAVSTACYATHASWCASPADAPAMTHAAQETWRRGLVGDTAADEYYSIDLDLREAARIVKEPGFMWRAAEADAQARGQPVEQYLADVLSKAEAFVGSDELHDREAITGILRNKVFERKGQLVLVLGGKSVGKSFILRKVAKDMEAKNGTVVYNARTLGADMTRGIMHAVIEQQDEKFFSSVLQRLKILAAGAAGAAASAAAGRIGAGDAGVAHARAAATDAVNKSLSTDPPTLHAVLGAFVEECKAEGRYPCLVIDEANAALEATTEEGRKRTIAALQDLVFYTKESQQMNVVLASSEHTEPFRLNALGFKSDHWTRTVVVGEVSPKAMRELLQKKWGMGEHLCDAAMSCWGGVVWGTLNGLSMLEQDREMFTVDANQVALSFDAVHGAATCAQAERSLGLKGMRELLRTAAQRGWAPFSKELDPRVLLGSQRNVLAVVMKQAHAPHVPSAAFAEKRSIVVPASQAMRLLIADELQQEQQQLPWLQQLWSWLRHG